MSRPDRPYRATRHTDDVTIHWDYATTFYRVRRTVDGKRQWLDVDAAAWVDAPGRSSWWGKRDGHFGADNAAETHGGKVITVRHKPGFAKPRTHDRAWALRQLAKGRVISNVSWAPSGRVYMSESGPRFGDGEFITSGLDTTDGYTLWQEPGK